jgi:diadenylate cyclase
LYRLTAQLFDPQTRQVIVNVVDILLVAYVIYWLLKLVRGKRAWRIVIGIIVFVVALVVSDWMQLYTLHWILDKLTLLAPVALVILFLPELRQAVEGFGKLGGWTERLMSAQHQTGTDAVLEVCTAVAEMAEHRIGALLVIERTANLQEIADNGIPVHARITAPLLGAIFYHGNPLHDGAVVVRGNEVVAAACRLPMSDSRVLPPHYHMRHRAGLGMSEHSDAIVVIVSEERGEIAVAQEGTIKFVEDELELRRFLDRELRDPREIRRRKRLRRKSRQSHDPESKQEAVTK